MNMNVTSIHSHDSLDSPHSKKSVLLNGTHPSRTVLRAVKRQVEKWIAREQSLLFLPKDASYTVDIYGTPDQPYYFDCQVHVRIGSREWEGHEYGRTLQDALARSLEHLRYIHAVA